MKFCAHGGRELERERTGSSLMDFSANINPWGPPDVLREAWPDLFQYVSVYPPLDLDYCRQAIACLTGFPAETILPTNGAMQAIALLARRLPAGTYQVLEPLFTEYARTFALEGKHIIHRLVFPGDDEREAGNVFEERGLRGLVLGNPGNPTGTSFSRSFLEQALEWSDKTGAYLVVDEAFQDFMDEKTSLFPRLFDSPRLFVIRSLTKFYALAGLRGGYLLGRPNDIRELEAHIEPWSTNAILSRALKLLADADLALFREATRRNLQQEKQYIQDHFSGWHHCVTLFPSQVNFFLGQVRGDTLDLPSLLVDRGIMVREAADFWGLDRRHFRFSVRTRPENERLIKTMEECLVEV